MDKNENIIGKNITDTLTSLGKRQSWLVTKLKGKVSQSYLNELINGKYANPSYKKLNDIAETLGVTITQLVNKNLF